MRRAAEILWFRNRLNAGSLRSRWFVLPPPVLLFLTYEDAQRGVHEADDAAEV